MRMTEKLSYHESVSRYPGRKGLTDWDATRRHIMVKEKNGRKERDPKLLETRRQMK